MKPRKSPEDRLLGADVELEEHFSNYEVIK